MSTPRIFKSSGFPEALHASQMPGLSLPYSIHKQKSCVYSLPASAVPVITGIQPFVAGGEALPSREKECHQSSAWLTLRWQLFSCKKHFLSTLDFFAHRQYLQAGGDSGEGFTWEEPQHTPVGQSLRILLLCRYQPAEPGSC